MAECNLLWTLKTRKAKYYNVTLKARSCNQICGGKALYVTYSERVFVTLSIQRAMCVHGTVICVLPASTRFFPHYSINGMIFGRRREGEGEGELLNMKFVF